MLPRSDKVYVTITVIAASVIILLSLIAAVRAWTGGDEPRPEYESAPAPSLVPPPDDSIADPSNAARPYISDEDYLFLHRSTRLLAPKLMVSGWQAAARKAGATEGAIQGAAEDIKRLQDMVRGLTPSEARRIVINRPVGGKSRTSTKVRFVGRDSYGQPLDPTLITYALFWRFDDKTRQWALYDIQVDGAGGGTTAPSEESSTGDGTGSSSSDEDSVPSFSLGDEEENSTGDGVG